MTGQVFIASPSTETLVLWGVRDVNDAALQQSCMSYLWGVQLVLTVAATLMNSDATGYTP